MSGRRFKRRDGLRTVTQTAELLAEKALITPMTSAILFAWLREKGWLPEKGLETIPTPVAVRNGWMDWDEHTFHHKTDNRPDRSITPLITRQGYAEIASRLKEERANDG